MLYPERVVTTSAVPVCRHDIDHTRLTHLLMEYIYIYQRNQHRVGASLKRTRRIKELNATEPI